MTTMKFGLFGGAQAVPGEVVTEAALGYHEYGDYIRLAEKLGYSSAWLVEHHFTGFSQLSATLNYISYLAGITETIRLGSAVVVVPWHNPILLAEQVATIDQISRGRYDFGVGRGYRATEFEGFGLDMAEAGAIFEESVALLKKSFTTPERWSYKSERWEFNDVIVEPPVVQAPHPPMWVGAGSEASIRKAAREGFNLLLDQISSFEAIGEKVAIYRDELDKNDKPFDPYAIGVTRGLMAANNDTERRDAYELRAKFITQVQVLTNKKTEGPRAFNPVGETTDVDALSDNGAILGSSDEMAERVQRLADLGVRNILLHDLAGRSEALQQFAEEVMPHFTGGDAKAAAAE
ncbi:MAG: LLM class flavin-dependent oxidoreductase [Alphaproteobacteria bacterium]|jgi:alkanesulfonate monooxygenase SsuD/methylene tetrahydromethanopterin reductase-like flavin-dependent oxidoreductase (luciferase family)